MHYIDHHFVVVLNAWDWMVYWTQVVRNDISQTFHFRGIDGVVILTLLLLFIIDYRMLDAYIENKIQ